jgi:hypothetical protein
MKICNFYEFVNEELQARDLNSMIHYLYNDGNTNKLVKYTGKSGSKYKFETIDHSAPIRKYNLTSSEVSKKI